MSDEALDVGNGDCHMRYRCDGFNMENKTVNMHPCKGCNLRTPHCHAKCQSYADYKTEMARHQKRHYYEDYIFTDYIRSTHRTKRRR